VVLWLTTHCEKGFFSKASEKNYFSLSLPFLSIKYLRKGSEKGSMTFGQNPFDRHTFWLSYKWLTDIWLTDTWLTDI
jgi:hypothetical protein